MSKPRTVTRFVEETVTIGQVAYEAQHRAAGIEGQCPWRDLGDRGRAWWEAAAAAVAEAIEGERDDEPAQRVETKPVPTEQEKLAALKITGTLQPDPLKVVFQGLVISLANIPHGSLLFVDNLGDFYALHPDGKRVRLSKSAQSRVYPTATTTADGQRQPAGGAHTQADLDSLLIQPSEPLLRGTVTVGGSFE